MAGLDLILHTSSNRVGFWRLIWSVCHMTVMCLSSSLSNYTYMLPLDFNASSYRCFVEWRAQFAVEFHDEFAQFFVVRETGEPMSLRWVRRQYEVDAHIG